MQRQEPGECLQFRRLILSRTDPLQFHSGHLQCLGSVTLHLAPHRLRHEHVREIRQQVQAAKLVQMDQRPGVANHQHAR